MQEWVLTLEKKLKSWERDFSDIIEKNENMKTDMIRLWTSSTRWVRLYLQIDSRERPEIAKDASEAKKRSIWGERD